LPENDLQFLNNNIENLSYFMNLYAKAMEKLGEIRRDDMNDS